ncbi:MAG: VWA domain-containing protein [Bryobacterales bacterium]|nr:VWA domain-containing protein [Bryobacterales bacterium]
MTFERAWCLLLVPLPFAWMWWQWRHVTRKRALVLKTICFALIALALAGPVMSVSETKVALTVLADTSASISEQDLKQSSSLITSLQRARGRNEVRVLPFARGVRPWSTTEETGKASLTLAAGSAGRATDIEAALRDAVAASPEGLVPRIALISDGNENEGSITRAVWQARSLGVPVDTYKLNGRQRPELRLESVRMPTIAFTGERFPIELTVQSPRAVSANVKLVAEGRTLGETRTELTAGANSLALQASLAAAGVVELSGSLSAEGMGEVRFTQAVTLRRPKLLLLSQDPAGVDSHWRQAMQQSQFDAAEARAWPTTPLDEFQVLVFNNWDLESLNPSQKSNLEAYVQAGGGLLVIGGERNVYVDKKGIEDALDRVLPAKVAPPRSPEGTTVVLIIDKSSSMEGKKMELARIAAIGVVENVRPIDLIGVLIFDNSFQWAVPIRKAEDKPLIKRLVAGITPDGGTQIAPALTEGYRRIAPVQATFKHIVLLTDGISEEGDSIALAKEAALNKTTISTVGLGQDVNRAYLEKVATFAKGKSYFLTDPSGLEQILLRDVMEHTGSTAVEKPIVPIIAREAEVLEGVPMAKAPPLKGYVRFTSKPTAETILKVEERDPLFVRWQYGLGRAAVFTSDAKARWAADWVGWEGFDRFWANVTRDLLPHAQPVEAWLEHDSAANEVIAHYRLGRGMAEPDRAPEVFLFGPGGFQRPLPLRKVAAATWQGSVPVGARKGLFRARPLADSRAFPEVGLYLEERELNEYGSNEALLRQVAAFTGGRFQPALAQAFDDAGRSVPSTLRLWPGLLLLAVLFNIAELIDRKWKGLVEMAQRWRG